jgi:hypothetical protein
MFLELPENSQSNQEGGLDAFLEWGKAPLLSVNFFFPLCPVISPTNEALANCLL